MPSGCYMYHQFNIQNSTFYPRSLFMCCVWISEQTAIISLYSINWLVSIERFNPLKPSGYYMHHQVKQQNNSTFYPHSVFMCFVWIYEQTAIISLYSINWLFFKERFNPLKPSGYYIYHQV